MSMLQRAFEIIEAKINKLLNKLEDPNETLDLSYEKMVAGLQEVKSHLADVVTEQKHLEQKVEQVKNAIADRDNQARAALQIGKEDLAKSALELKLQETTHLQQLQESLTAITAQADKLKFAQQKFQQRIDAFREQKEIAKANYQASSAQVKVNESLSGVSKELGGVGQALDKANEKMENMKARAAAIDALTEEGILNDPLAKGDTISQQLDKAKQQATVQDELEKLKNEIKSSDK